jgi:2-C-methyl-D-erythritol 2,4-cyclodiphosphate synthase
MNMRIGIGYDAHAFAEGRRLVLGGVDIDFPRGLAGHSDADVLVHALIDALLGAASLGDIGVHFPDRDPQFKDARSIELLDKTHAMLGAGGFEIINIDCVVICERPKIAPYAERMKSALSAALGGLPAARIGIKGKTTEGLGFTGRAEGIAAQAVALLRVSGSS